MSHDYDLIIEALQADIDTGKERYARLLKETEVLRHANEKQNSALVDFSREIELLKAEHAALKILHEGAQHMNMGFAQQVTTLTARVAELESLVVQLSAVRGVTK